jgi:Tfp pilus assembly protein PilN
MIEINLLPGTRKKTKSSGGSSFDFKATFAALTARFKDPWLGFAIGGVAIGVLGIGGLWFLQSRTSAALLEQERIAVMDSTRYDAVVKQRRAAEAQRDSIIRQMSVIALIDGDRYVWPHLMDEVSRALPTYTWLTSLFQQGGAAASSPEAIAAGVAPAISVRLVGYTVEAQAITVYMKQLEDSPFLENIQIISSDVAEVEGKTVTEFTLDLRYSKPDPSILRTAPLSIAVR